VISDLQNFSAVPDHIMNIWKNFYWNSSTKYRDIASRELAIMDDNGWISGWVCHSRKAHLASLWSWLLTLKTFSAVATHIVNICAKFHWNLSTKYGYCVMHNTW